MNLSMKGRRVKGGVGFLNQTRAKARLRIELNEQSRKSRSGSFNKWCEEVTPEWDWKPIHIQHIHWHLDKVTQGRIRKLMVNLPPRHSKTESITVHYSAYRLELDPTTTILVVAHTQGLATKLSRKIKKIVERRVEMSKSKKSAQEWETAAGGGVKAVGVMGVGGGLGFDLIICDDIVKSRKEANSATYRDRIADAYKDDISTRLNPGGAILIPFTRWHLQDIGGHILDSEDGPNWKVLRLPALAERDDPLGRKEGEALWPGRWPKPYLEERRRVMGRSFFPIYQQAPLSGGGDLFKPSDFLPEWNELPGGCEFVRFWDKASTEGGDGAETAGVLMAKTPNGVYVVCDVVHGRWGPAERERRMRETAIVDGPDVTIWIEQEPGGGGKESGLVSVKGLAGFKVHLQTMSNQGDKVARAEPMAAQAEVQNIKILKDHPNRRWNGTFLAQLQDFPQGKLKDIVDAASGAFNKLALKGDSGAPVASESRPGLQTLGGQWEDII